MAATFNSITDSHDVVDIIFKPFKNINFQFPNGFSQTFLRALEKLINLFQFPNGFSRQTNSAVRPRTSANFQFPNGFSLGVGIGTAIDIITLLSIP